MPVNADEVRHLVNELRELSRQQRDHGAPLTRQWSEVSAALADMVESSEGFSTAEVRLTPNAVEAIADAVVAKLFTTFPPDPESGAVESTAAPEGAQAATQAVLPPSKVTQPPPGR